MPRRPQPARDDKVVTAWNGFAITALAEASVALAEPALLDAATACARAIVALHVDDGRLRRASLGGRVGDSAAILEDHAALATALLTLFQITGDGQWLDTATGLLDVALEHFSDPDHDGRWFDTADDAERLMVRPSDPIDGATPSGASLIAEALQLAAHLTPAPLADRYAAAASDAVSAATPILVKLPRSGGHWLAVAEASVRGPIQIAVACDSADSELLAAARALAPGGAVVVGGAVDSSELLLGRDRSRRPRRRLRVPWPRMRPAGHDRGGTRRRARVPPCSVRHMARAACRADHRDRQPLSGVRCEGRRR